MNIEETKVGNFICIYDERNQAPKRKMKDRDK